MEWLPVANDEGYGSALPLPETAAAQVAQIWLCPDKEMRKRLARELLASEPTLALWTYLGYEGATGERLPGLSDLAQWFAEHGFSLWRATGEIHAPSLTADRLAEWGELAARSISLAEAVASEAPEYLRDRAYVCGLLHQARNWWGRTGAPAALRIESRLSASFARDDGSMSADECSSDNDGSRDRRSDRRVGADESPGSEPSDVPRESSSRGTAIAGSAEDSSEWGVIREALRKAVLRRETEGTENDAIRETVETGEVSSEQAVSHRDVSWIRLRWQAALPVPTTWLASLARHMRQMRRLEQRFHEAVEHEKLTALKEFAYGASHEINNPLANISTRAQTLLRDERDPERRRKLATINSQAFRAHEMISDLMLFARPPLIEPRPTPLKPLVDSVLDELREIAEGQGTAITTELRDPDLTVFADPTFLAVALKSLAMNSLEAVGAGGYLEIAAQAGDFVGDESSGPMPATLISVRDNGPGIPDEMRSRLFDPYFSGREAGRGLGLGLSKCWRIVTLHGGRIDVASGLEGTTFTIRLPAMRTDACLREGMLTTGS